MIGISPFTGFGMNTSSGQTVTHRLQPLHMLGLKMTGRPGVGRLGAARRTDDVIGEPPISEYCGRSRRSVIPVTFGCDRYHPFPRVVRSKISAESVRQRDERSCILQMCRSAFGGLNCFP